jgi:hypothetical protein
MEEDLRLRFTLKELFVASTILILLLALAVSGVTSGQRQSRLRACEANLRQLARAFAIRATVQPATLGGYLEPLRAAANSTITEEDPATAAHELIVAWPTRLLPHIESSPLWEQILVGDKNLNVNAPPPMEIFYCPSDPPIDVAAGGLSYVVNSGMPDLVEASENQPSDLKANGVCHDQRPGRFGPAVRLGTIDLKDGADRTILLSENIHRDPPGTAGQPGNTWLRPAKNGTNLEQWYGMVWVVDEKSPRSPRAELMDHFNCDTRNDAERDQPYASSGTRFARPASNHPEIFNVAFCGGNVRTIRDAIDYAVYQQLMTPDGAKAAPADAPDERFEKTLPNDQRFMNPPLTDGDY